MIGQAILEAIEYERKLKVTGIGIHEKALPLFRNHRGKIGNVWWTINPIVEICDLGGVHLVSSDLHMARWKHFCSNHFGEHAYTATAKTLFERSGLWNTGA